MSEPLLDRFDCLNVWRRAGQHVQHKPLLVLYALGRWCNGDEGAVPFAEAEPRLTELLKEFGPPRQSYHPEYPFWRLQNDGVWEVKADGPLTPRQSNSDIPKGELIARHASGSFTEDVKAALRSEPALAGRIAARLLANHFPESIHPDILAAVGLDITPAGERIGTGEKRDPRFRQRVLTAYEWRCAVCGFDVRLGSSSIALDAAHIRWHQAGGPAVESNGLALCVLHHKTFDLGAFTVTPGGVLLVSDQATTSAHSHSNAQNNVLGPGGTEHLRRRAAQPRALAQAEARGSRPAAGHGGAVFHPPAVR